MTKAVGARDVSSSVVFAGLNVSILVPSADLVDPSAGRVRGFFDRHPVESKTERDFFPAAWMRDDGEQTLSFHSLPLRCRAGRSSSPGSLAE